MPKPFEVDDPAEVLTFIAKIGAADLVTMSSSGAPIATLMPCYWEIVEGNEFPEGNLVMHMSKGNQQWKSIGAGTTGLAIVHGPQAYVSPSNYEAKLTDHKVVPTWNYQSIHLTGVVEVSEDVELLQRIVSNLTDLHEHGRVDPWRVTQAEPRYLEAQLRGIVAVTLQVKTIEAKYKLSQNRSGADRRAVAEDLERSKFSQDHEIAVAMQRSFDINSEG